MAAREKAKYFHISAKCVKYVNVDGCDHDEEETTIDTLLKSNSSSMPAELESMLGFIEKNGKKYKPSTITISCVVPSMNGRYVPSKIEQYIKEMAKVEEVCINFVREMSQEEFEEDAENRERIKNLEENGPPLSDALRQDIEDLIGRAEKGALRVPKPEGKSPNIAEAPYNPLTDNLDDLYED
jgi:hypothetical protein